MTRTLKAAALLVAIAVAAGAGCTVEKQEAPDAVRAVRARRRRITLYASPDTLRQDGASQSQITIQAQDSKGSRLRNLPDPAGHRRRRHDRRTSASCPARTS